MSASVWKRAVLSTGALALAILASVLVLALPDQRAAVASAALSYVDRHIENGDSAWMGVGLPASVPGDPRSACWLSVGVSRGGAPLAPTTYLHYEVTHWDPTYVWPPKGDYQPDPGACLTLEGADGLIPNSAYRVAGQTETLKIDTRAVQGFAPWAGSGGVISITWRKTGEIESRHSGSDWSRFPGFSRHESGTRSGSSALASGTVLGNSVETHDPWGASVGSNQNVIVCRSSDPGVDCFSEK